MSILTDHNHKLLGHLGHHAGHIQKKITAHDTFWADPAHVTYARAPAHLHVHSWEHAYPRGSEGYGMFGKNPDEQFRSVMHRSQLNASKTYRAVKQAAKSSGYWSRFHPDIQNRATVMAYAHLKGHHHANIHGALQHPEFSRLVRNARLLSSTPRTPYQHSWEHVLGVHRHAGPKAAKMAYKKLAVVHHPNKGGTTHNFQRIGAAFDASRTYHGV
jgi:hypothetical protein